MKNLLIAFVLMLVASPAMAGIKIFNGVDAIQAALDSAEFQELKENYEQDIKSVEYRKENGKFIVQVNLQHSPTAPACMIYVSLTVVTDSNQGPIKPMGFAGHLEVLEAIPVCQR